MENRKERVLLEVETDEVPRRVLTLFFIIDTSGSMSGSKIQAVNDAMENIIPLIGDISKSNENAKIKIACMQFDSNVKWMTTVPRDANEFKYIDLTAQGMTSFGAALADLEKRLHVKGGWMNEENNSHVPVYILLSDGGPTDSYKERLAALKKNKWFEHGVKIAIAIGNDTNKNVLAEFTGNAEYVITVHDIETLKTLIQFVSVTASMRASQSSGVGDKGVQEQIGEAIKKEIVDKGGNADIGVAPSHRKDGW